MSLTGKVSNAGSVNRQTLNGLSDSHIIGAVMPHTISASNISKQFIDGDRRIDVIRSLSFDLAGGESLAVTGPSGSGKSTLLNLLAGVLPLDDGELALDLPGGAILMHKTAERERTAIRRRHIGYVYQFFNLVPTLTVLENVRLPARLNRRPDLDRRASDLLEDFGLVDRFDAFPEVLSGGEQQRVAVARALLMSPPLLLADEPTGNLDLDNTKQVADLLFRTAKDLGVALIIATHNPEVAAMADQQLQLSSRPAL